MATASPVHGLHDPLVVAKKATGWYIAAAIIFIVLGVFAILEPGVAGLGITMLIGWLLIFAGVTHFITAFKGGSAKHIIFQVLMGILYLVGGFYCMSHPLLAISTLTLLLASIILVEGVLEIISYFRQRRDGASGWILFNALVTLLLGGMIWFHWPSSSVWAIGILVGVNLMMTGITRLMLGMAARRLVGQTAE
jgi:uncharacterized membrane protein HdeD (DUF308 family)